MTFLVSGRLLYFPKGGKVRGNLSKERVVSEEVGNGALAGKYAHTHELLPVIAQHPVHRSLSNEDMTDLHVDAT